MPARRFTLVLLGLLATITPARATERVVRVFDEQPPGARGDPRGRRVAHGERCAHGAKLHSVAEAVTRAVRGGLA